jgi:pyruvate dehydrogenase E2 component (dihydrolipoamide acetyltransferase)
MATELKVPELGENVKGGDVLRLLVKVGDTLTTDQPVVELETDKATVEIPSTVTGKVASIAVKPGDKITVGQPILSVEDDRAAEAPSPQAPAAGADAGTASAGEGATPPEPKKAASAQEAVAEQEGGASGSDTPSPGAQPRAAADAPPRAEGADRGAAPSAAADGSGATFAVPELGENIKGGDVLRVLVKVGDNVAVDQPVIELETDKATVEVPSSIAGPVTAVNVKPGDKVSVGQPIFTVASGASAEAPAKESIAQVAASSKETPQEAAAASSQVVQGFSARASTEAPRARSRPAEVVDISRGARTAAAVEPAAKDARPPAPAAPSVRRLARELGLDIHDVPGSGPGGRISTDDVMAFAKRVITSRPAAGVAAAGAPAAAAELPDFSKWGPIDRQSMRAIRRKTAEHLGLAWSLIPHVTQVEEADVTDLEAARGNLGKRVEAAGGKLTVTAVTLKVVANALKTFPQFNASVDMAEGAIVYKGYVHVGVAVDTDRGLLVPVIRDVDQKSIVQLSVELTQAAEKARAGKLSIDEMQGGCFTITNLGGIGGTHFTPIVNYPEVAILGMSRARMTPVWRDGQFVPRLMLPLSLSYDHRLIDGADAMRFLRYVVDSLEQPLLMVLGA